MFENIDIKTFSPDFEEWIDENIKLKNCKVQLFKTLLEKGYQYDLIKNRLNIDYNRISLRTAELINYKNLKIYSIKNFLTTEECDEIIEKIQNEPEETSTTMMDEGSDITKSNYRTSTTISNLNISNIEDKICKRENIYGRKNCKRGEKKFQSLANVNRGSILNFIKPYRSEKPCRFFFVLLFSKREIKTLKDRFYLFFHSTSDKIFLFFF